MVNPILDFWAAEARVGDGKVALQPQPMGDVLLYGRQIELGMELKLAFQYRGVGAHRKS